MSHTIQDLRAKWSAFAASSGGQRSLKAVRVLFIVGITAYLGYGLTKIGWGQIWESLPTHPLFYLIFLVLYFSLPLSEVIIYRLTWTYDVRRSLFAFFKKRVYNREVFGYSGEVYFYTWARKNVRLPGLEILKTIRDNNILSSAAATIIAAALLAVFVFTGRISLAEWVEQENLSYYLIGGGVMAAILLPFGLRFRRYIFSMPFKLALLIFGMHCMRLLMSYALQVVQWAVAVPEVPLHTWLTYLAVNIIVYRIPLIPNRDLIFLGVGIELSALMQVPAAAVASMLLVNSVLGKGTNFLLFTLASLFDRSGAAGVAGPGSGPGSDLNPDGPEGVEERYLAVPASEA